MHLHRSGHEHDRHTADNLGALLAEEAARRSLTPDELAARVLAEQIPARRHLGFVAIGDSTSGRNAAETKRMLSERVQPPILTLIP